MVRGTPRLGRKPAVKHCLMSRPDDEVFGSGVGSDGKIDDAEESLQSYSRDQLKTELAEPNAAKLS